MMAGTELRIPDRQKGVFQSLADSSKDRLESIITILRESQPSLSLHRLVEFVAQRANMGEKEALQIVSTISSLYSLRDQPGFSAKDLREEILAAVDADEELSVTDEGRERLARFLQEVLSLDDTLGITSKALSVASDSQRTYYSSRVLTDLRPVFKPDSDEAAAFVLVHNLKIVYHEGADLKEFFVSLTGKDLREALKVLKRAEKKEVSLKAVVANCEVSLLEADNG